MSVGERYASFEGESIFECDLRRVTWLADMPSYTHHTISRVGLWVYGNDRLVRYRSNMIGFPKFYAPCVRCPLAMQNVRKWPREHSRSLPRTGVVERGNTGRNFSGKQASLASTLREKGAGGGGPLVPCPSHGQGSWIGQGIFGEVSFFMLLVLSASRGSSVRSFLVRRTLPPLPTTSLYCSAALSSDCAASAQKICCCR